MNYPFKQGKAKIALKMPGYYIWDTSVIKAEGRYWMFVSRWKKELGFGWNWLFHSQIVLTVSDNPEGPYNFVKVIFERRDKKYFDGMNTHNPCIKYYNGKYYLFYMGDTYDFEPPHHYYEITQEMVDPTWLNKRIGLAISDKIDGEYIRSDKPILLPRNYPSWDSTITTNPTVVIKNNGETFMLYKSKKKDVNSGDNNPLQIGIAHASIPEGPYQRFSDGPILDIPGIALEDPYVWYDEKRNIFCALMKDCIGNISGAWGNLIYTESEDCKKFKIDENPTIIRRLITWEDGRETLQCNLERPCILFDDNNQPSYLFCASGDGNRPFFFEDESYVVCIKLEKRERHEN